MLTFVYLALELPFAAHLLDVVGTTSDPDVIHKTEVTGRLVSGLAAALMLWGLVLIPRAVKKRRAMKEPKLRDQLALGARTTVVCVVAAVPIVVIVYLLEALIVDAIVYSSTPQQRQTAFGVLLFTSQYQKGLATIEGFALTPEEIRSPAGKTFMAVLPAMAGGMKNIREKLDPSLRVFAAQKVMEKLGPPGAFYNQAYVGALRKLNDSYRQYIAGVRQLYEGYEEADRKAEQGWNDYLADLRKRRLRFPPAAIYCNRIKKNVRAAGNPVPDHWNCADKTIFIKSARDKGYRQADDTFRDRTRRQAGEPLPSNLLSFAQFIESPVIQRNWRRELDAGSEVSLRLGETQESFRRNVYDAIVQAQVERQIRRVKSDVGLFEPGGLYFVDGQEAYRALVVAPIALFFSLLGAFSHFIKSLVTSSFFYSRSTPGLRRRIMAAGIALSLSTLLIPNVLTRTELYSRMLSEVRNSADGWLAPLAQIQAFTIAWIAHTQSFIYPLNDAVRMLTSRLGEPYDSAPIALIAKWTEPPHHKRSVEEEPVIASAGSAVPSGPRSARPAAATAAPVASSPPAADTPVEDDTGPVGNARGGVLGRFASAQAEQVKQAAKATYNDTLRRGTCDQRRQNMLRPLPQALPLSRYARDIYRKGRDDEMLAGNLTRLDLGNGAMAYRAVEGARYAESYSDPGNHRTILVFRGTRVKMASDIATDVANQLGLDTAYYRWAAELTGLVRAEHPETALVVTGQSLGGGLAIHSVLKNPGVTGVAFNPAGLSLAAWSAADAATKARVNAAVTVWSTRSSKQIEPITALSMAGRSVLPGHIFFAPIEIENERALHGPDAVVSALETLSSSQAAGNACDDDLGVLAR